MANEFAESFNNRVVEEPNTLEDIERKYAALDWGSNTEGKRAPQSNVVEGNGPKQEKADENNEDSLITNPEEGEGNVNNYEDFGRLLGSTRVVNNKAVVLIRP